MATGDQTDMLARIKSTLPPWFPDDSTILDGLLSGLAWASAHVYDLIQYAALQTRIKTATDGWLDMIAGDFFGDALKRATNQTDASFRARIIINLMRERATRKSVTLVLQDVTGRTPIIFEPQRPADTGAYRQPVTAYGAAGGYGSMLLPCQAFVTAYRQVSSGIPNVAGYGSSPGAYSTASRAELASIDSVQGALTDSDIYAAVASVLPAGVTAWTRISN